jgi:hypothetical protein
MIITATIIFIIPYIVCFFLYQQNKEINQMRLIEKNSYKEMFNIEVKRRRIYATLYENLKHNNLKLSTKYSNAIQYIKRKL